MRCASHSLRVRSGESGEEELEDPVVKHPIYCLPIYSLIVFAALCLGTSAVWGQGATGTATQTDCSVNVPVPLDASVHSDTITVAADPGVEDLEVGLAEYSAALCRLQDRESSLLPFHWQYLVHTQEAALEQAQTGR